MTGQPPNDDDVGEVVYNAFKELLELDPAGITTPVGLARTIAYRRGQDFGRSFNRRREFPIRTKSRPGVTDRRHQKSSS